MKKRIGSVALAMLALMSWGSVADAGLGWGLFGSHGSGGSSGSSGSYGSAGSSGGSYGSTGSSYASSGSTGSSGGSSGMTWRQERLLSRADRQVAVSSARSSSHGSSGGYGSTGSSGGSYGSAGSYAVSSSHGSSGSYGSTGSTQSTGTIRYALRRKIDRAFRPSPSYGSAGSSGSYGSTGSYSSSGSYGSSGSNGSTGSYGSARSYSSTGSYGSAAARSSYSRYQASAAPTPSVRIARRPVAPARVASVAPQQFAFVVVTLPQDATLYLGGHKTTTSGAVRKFKIPVTTQAISKPYDVKVVLKRNGQTYVANSQERLAIGGTTSVKVNDVATSRLNVATR